MLDYKEDFFRAVIKLNVAKVRRGEITEGLVLLQLAGVTLGRLPQEATNVCALFGTFSCIFLKVGVIHAAPVNGLFFFSVLFCEGLKAET